jgi:hypothetical protein
VLRLVADEVERNPALALRVAEASSQLPAVPRARERAHAQANQVADAARGVAGVGAQPFTPRLVTGTSPDLGPGIPDPLALRARLGREGLRAALDDLRVGTLRAIVREHQIDPAGHASQQHDAVRLRQLILSATDQPR